MIELKEFSGVMDLDSGEDFISPRSHRYALNGRFIMSDGRARYQNVYGNAAISNSLPAGTNQCIGAHYDSVRRRIYFFNYNSNGRNGIYYYSLTAGTITKVFLCFTDSATDILGFSLNYPIHSAAVVYQQSPDGDLLYWTDGTNRPRYLNVATVSTLAPFTESMINAAKNAPMKNPSAAYRDDATVNSNSLRKKLFRFRYRWVYKNGERSTWSPITKEPLPISDDNPTIQNDPTKNNNIRVTVYGGGSDFQAIEIAGQMSLGAQWGDDFLIGKFDRTEYSIAVDGTFTFDFYNDSVYTFLDVKETILPFDFFPDKANTLELLNGNTIIYGGVTEGYDPMGRDDVNVTVTATTTSPSSTYGFSWKWGGQYRFGLVYFDDRGKTNGVVSFLADPVDSTDFAVATPLYSQSGGTTLLPRINASINHTPPTWATKYQWVRTKNSIASKFLYFTSNDYQVESGFIYIGIQSIVDYEKRNTGSVISYEFVQGDRVRVVAKYQLGTGFVVYSTQLDLEILGVVERNMTSPATPGQFLKCALPTVFPSSPFQLMMLLEIYTPATKSSNDIEVFYEWGEQYDIYSSGGNRYHRGQIQDQTASQAATFRWDDGDVYYRQRTFDTILFILNVKGLIQDSNYSDFFGSAVNSNGRPWVIDENAAQIYNPVQSRWGEAYAIRNNLNRFYPENTDEAELSKGDIRRFKVRDSILRVFQDRGVGQYGVYSRFIKNNDGQDELIITNTIITKNNIQYYKGEYGLGGYPTNLCSSTIADYFNDIATGREVRLSGDGMTDLGQLYKGQFYLANLVTRYNQSVYRSDGSLAKVMKFWNPFDMESHTVLQGGSISGSEQLPNDVGTTVTAYHFNFNEPRNAYCSFFSYQPEWAIGAENLIYSWKNGVMYVHNSETYCNFYGTQYDTEIDVVFNDNLLERKTLNDITEISSAVWDVPLIYTNVKTYGTQRQESKLIPQNFSTLEGTFNAAVWRDQKSRGGWINGDIMKANWSVWKFRKQNASSLIYLSQLSMRYTDSPLTVTR